MSILASRFGVALAAGSITGIASYAYNLVGKQGKLPGNMGFVTPPKTFAALVSGSTAALVLISPKYSPTLAIGMMGAITLIALNNSKRENQEARKADEAAYRNNLKNRDFGKEASQNVHS